MSRMALVLAASVLVVGVLGAGQMSRRLCLPGSQQEQCGTVERDVDEVQAVREMQGIDVLASWQEVEHGSERVISVKISDLKGSESLSSLRELRSLERVSFHGCEFTLAQVQTLADSIGHVNRLYFDTCSWPMGTFSRLRKLKRVHDLLLINCELHDSDFPAISRWESLRFLSLARSNFFLSFEADLGKNRELESLHLLKTSIGDSEVSQLLGAFPGVRELHLDETGVSNEGVKAIASAASKLRELTVKGTDVSSDLALAELAKVEGLCWLSCGHPLLQGEFLEAFANHPNFRAISITTPCLDESFFRLVGKNPRLRWLDVRASGVTDAMLKEIGKHPTIEYLGVSFNPLSDEILPLLEEWPALQYVASAATGIDEDAREKWGDPAIIQEISRRLEAED